MNLFVALFLVTLLLDPATPAAVAAVSVWTPATVAVLITATAALIAAIGTAAAAVIREIRAKASVGAAAGEQRDQKLDRIEILVNGRYSQVLQDLADVKRTLADVSGTARDQAAAARAQQTADDQHARVRAAGGLATPLPVLETPHE